MGEPITFEELQLAARNHAFPLEALRYDVTPVGLAASAAVLGTFVAMFWYNALVTPLAFTMLGYALLWRNGVRG